MYYTKIKKNEEWEASLLLLFVVPVPYLMVVDVGGRNMQ